MARQKAVKPFSDEQLDEWLKGKRTPEDVNGLLKQLTKAVVDAGRDERAPGLWETRSCGHTHRQQPERREPARR